MNVAAPMLTPRKDLPHGGLRDPKSAVNHKIRCYFAAGITKNSNRKSRIISWIIGF